jgi:hypothetical protein
VTQHVENIGAMSVQRSRLGSLVQKMAEMIVKGHRMNVEKRGGL